MRVSDRTTARNYLKYLNKAQDSYAKTNQQIASGCRFERLSDDVSSGTRVLRTRMDMFESQKQLDNVKNINDEMSSTETSMMSINDLLSELHSTKLVKAMNESTAQSGRDAIASEVKAMRESILQFANLRYGKRYVFGGSNASSTAPFTAGKDGRIEYNGIPVDDIQKDTDGFFYMDGAGKRQNIPMDDPVYMDIGLGLKMTGKDVDPNTGFLLSYSGLDILGFGKDAEGKSNNLYNMMLDIEKTLKEYETTPGAKDKLGKLDAHLVKETDRFRGNITDIGSKTQMLDNMQTRLESVVDNYQNRITNLMGTDDKEAATQLSMNEYVLKAVLSMGSRILPISLMDFLR